MTITEFLEARISEDEAVARAASHQKVAGPFHGNWRNDSLHLSSMEREDAAHIARHDPARVLAECAAKRAIIELAKDVAVIDDALMVESAGWLWETDKKILRALAVVYKGHEDYQEAWG